MFNGKRIKNLEWVVHGKEKEVLLYVGGYTIPKKSGLIERMSDIEKENEKLKAIVAEVIDYVYRSK